MDFLSKALFGAVILFFFFNPKILVAQSMDCEPRVDLTASLTGNSASQPASPNLVYAGQSFKAPANGGMADGIKVFFNRINANAPLTLSLHQGTTPGTITPAIATANYTNGATFVSDFPRGIPVCFEFANSIELTSNSDYYFLITTNCNNAVGCSIATIIDTRNPYPDGNRFTASATGTGTRTGDLKFTVYSGGCDDEAPIAVANNITINVGTNAGTYNLSPADIDAIAAGTTDNCPNFLTYEISDGSTDFSCIDDGQSFRVTLTAMDACENVDTETAFITINCKDPSPLTLESGNQLNFLDPCSCDDPLNCDIMGVTYFHDTLVVTAAGVTGLSITTVAGATDFFTDVPCSGGALTPVPTGTLIPETPSGSGIYKLEFWRPSGAVPTLSVEEVGAVTAVPMVTFDPACFQEDCNPIPTMSQWALVILAMIMASIGLVFMKNRNSSWAS